jgi:hypothetical protein
VTPERARGGVRAELRYFFVALGYFTRVPVPRAIGYAAGDLDQAARYSCGAARAARVDRGRPVDGRDAARNRRVP